jgi:hypothetical protein
MRSAPAADPDSNTPGGRGGEPASLIADTDQALEPLDLHR